MREYNIIKQDSGWYKVTLKDEYGCTTTVYEKSHDDASSFAIHWFDRAKKRRDNTISLNKAIQEMHRLDIESGILKGNRDGLD